MKDVQPRLDKAAKILMALIKEAEDGAEEACGAGEFETSEKLHTIAAHMRMAYGVGRGLKTSDGIQARAGAK